MCTTFVRKGKDLIIGFNFDIDENAFEYKIQKNRDIFYVGIKVGSTIYKTHGVNKNGNFGNLPFMNDPTVGMFKRGKDCRRLDLLNDQFIGAKMSYTELLKTVKMKRVVNPPNMSMHSQFVDRYGHVLIVEPGVGYKESIEPYSIMTNFPILKRNEDLSAEHYGLKRYETCKAVLENSNEAFSVEDGLALLDSVRQEGKWATRISFLYSQNNNSVYYFMQGNKNRVIKHLLG